MTVELKLSDVTVGTGTLTGDGSFDVMMQAMTSHLNSEYRNQHITGKDYAEVYLALTNSVLQQANLWTLTKDKAANEADLIAAQIKKIDAEILLVGQQVLSEKQNVEKMKQEVLLIQAKIESEEYNRDLIAAQVRKIEADIEFLNDEQTRKSNAETALIEQKTVTEEKQTEVIAKQIELTSEQILKIIAERGLLDQRTESEEAETVGDIIENADGSFSSTIGGIKGSQMTLYKAQEEGFFRDAEQKLTKMMLDTLTTRMTIDSGTTVSGNGVNDSEINRVLNVAKGGVGLTAFEPTP